MITLCFEYPSAPQHHPAALALPPAEFAMVRGVTADTQIVLGMYATAQKLLRQKGILQTIKLRVKAIVCA